MTEGNSRYVVEKEHIESYLKKRFVYSAITFAIMAAIVFLLLAFIVYNINPVGLWSFAFSIPVVSGAFLLGIKLWNDKLRELSGTEYNLANERIIQVTQNKEERNFKYSEIAVISKRKFGTTVVKGNWWTKISFYWPSRFNTYQQGNASVIFIPSVTTNYSELIERLKQLKEIKQS